MAGVPDETPPAGEDIHLPGPSVLPLVVAVAITCMVVGLTITWWFSIFGTAAFIIAVTIWVRDTRRDIAELPEEHHH